jgi:hypothetical protein
MLDHDLFISGQRLVAKVFRRLEYLWQYVKGDTGGSMYS